MLILLTVVIVVVILVVRAAAADRDTSTGVGEDRLVPTAASALAVQEYLALVESGFRHGMLRVCDEEDLRDVPVVLEPGEVVIYAAAETATFSEERSERLFAGGSMRVVGSVRVFGGGTQSIPRLTAVDEGRAILTNRRILFLGRLRTVEVPVGSLVGLRYDDTGLALHVSNRAKNVQIQAPGESLILGRSLEYLVSKRKWSLVRYQDSTALVWEGSEIARGCGERA